MSTNLYELLSKPFQEFSGSVAIDCHERGVWTYGELEEQTARYADWLIGLGVKPGDRLGLVGHNGAGKTTLLRLLAGIFKPMSGSAKISGSVMPLINFDLGMNMEASGYENILLSGLVLGLPHDEIERNMETIIAFSGLGDAIHQPVRTYSSGMRMRLAFSLSTSVRSQILLLDEWLSVGDEDFQQKAKDRMNEMVDASEIIILSSHSRDIIENVCNRVVFLENGRIVADGDVDEICNLYFGERI